MRGTWGALGVILAVAWAGPAGAVLFDTVGMHGWGRTRVNFTYAPLSPTSGRVSVDITNNSSMPGPSEFPKFTGFVFNLPPSVTGVASFVGPPAAINGGFALLYGPDSLDLAYDNLGAFDIGTSTYRTDAGIPPESFLTRGGPPAPGSAVGQTINFQFTLDGSGMDLLTAQSFLRELSIDPPGGGPELTIPFMAQVITLSGTYRDSSVNFTHRTQDVPEPAGLLPAGAALAGGAAVRAWRRARRRRPSGAR